MTRSGGKRALAIVAVLLLGGGCARAPQLVRAPIDINESVTVVQLELPFHALGPLCELRLEFDRPGDSHHAGKIHAAFVTSEGKRDTLTDVRLDRRGESAVSQFGHLGVDSVASTRPRIYNVLELWSDVPLRLRGVRGESRQ